MVNVGWKTLIKTQNAMLYFIVFLNGFFYIFFIPPWQKPDEPGHFEYAWLIANYQKVPKTGDFDWSFRRELVSSMIESDFFDDKILPPQLLSISNPPSIITPQINNRPLYYLYISIFLYITKGTDIIFQLYTARIFSWILFLGTIYISQKILCEIMGKNHVISLIVPLSISLLPSFVDIMTAVNDDVGATFLFSLLFYVCVLIINRGISKKLLFCGVFITILCFYTKDTALISIPIFLLTIVLSKNRTFTNYKYFLYFIFLATLTCLLVCRWGDAKSWLRATLTVQSTPTSVIYQNAPDGKHTLELVVIKDQPLPRVIQFSRTESSDDIASYTIGSYIWCTEKDLSITPFRVIIDKEPVFLPAIQISNKQNFYHFSFQAPKNKSLRIEIYPLDVQTDKSISIYYDGIVLVEGVFPEDSIPQYIRNGEKLLWNLKYRSNLLQNSSFESRIPYLEPKLSLMIWQITRYIYSPNLIISSIFDLRNSGWYYISTIKQLNSTFWAKFGWGHVTLREFILPRPYLLLGVLSIIGLIGFLIQLIHNNKIFRRSESRIYFLFIMSILILWLLTFFRGITSLEGVVFIPGARYAFPVIIPTMFVLCSGWSFCFTFLKKSEDLVFFVIIIVLLLSLNLSSIYSIIHFYHL